MRTSGARSCPTTSFAGSARRRASCTWRPRPSSTRSGTCGRRARACPLWQLLAGLSPEELVARHRLPLHRGRPHTGRGNRPPAGQPSRGASANPRRRATGYPAYTTSAGWLGYEDDQVEELVRRARRRLPPREDEGRLDPAADVRRAELIRGALGPDGMLMMDANQVWGVDEAIAAMGRAGAIRSLVDRGAHEPRRRPRPRARPRRDRADPRGDRRARAEPRDLQAALPGRGDRHLPDRRLPRRRRERGARDHADGGQVRRARLPPRRRRRPVRVRAAPAVFDYVAVSGSLEGRVVEWVDHLHEHFVHPAVVERRPLPSADRARLQRRDARRRRSRSSRTPKARVWRRALVD